MPLKKQFSEYRYKTMIGVGGIGAGSFFAIRGNETLGREESRGGHFLKRKDYCKLHIISHYVCALLDKKFITLPIGKVGEDEVGIRLIKEMDDHGLDVRYVKRSKTDETLFSFCFIYPDGSGGNLTTDDSACSKVDGQYVKQVESEFHKFPSQGVALAAPEVSLEARSALLDYATQNNFFRVASFTSGEMLQAFKEKMLQQVDLLAINRDEAAAAVGLSAENTPLEELINATINRLRVENPALMLSITAGKNGSWSWDGKKLKNVKPLTVEVANTAGAGDAHISGIIAGLAVGLDLGLAQELGNLVAAMSVTSPHTINPDINCETLQAFALKTKANLNKSVYDLLEG